MYNQSQFSTLEFRLFKWRFGGRLKFQMIVGGFLGADYIMTHRPHKSEHGAFQSELGTQDIVDHEINLWADQPLIHIHSVHPRNRAATIDFVIDLSVEHFINSLIRY